MIDIHCGWIHEISYEVRYVKKSSLFSAQIIMYICGELVLVAELLNILPDNLWVVKKGNTFQYLLTIVAGLYYSYGKLILHLEYVFPDQKIYRLLDNANNLMANMFC